MKSLIGCCCGLLVVTTSIQAQVIAKWTFETSVPITAGPFAPETGSGAAMGSHVGATVYSSPAGNGSTHSFSSTLWAVGDYYQFQTSTIGNSGIQLSFDQTSSSTGPGAFKLAYSLDGSSFTDFATYTVLGNGLAPNAAWSAGTPVPAYNVAFDMSSVTALNNAAAVYFRLVDTSTTSASGGTVGTGGTDRVDNFTVQVPEPASMVLAGLGLLGVVLRRRRN